MSSRQNSIVVGLDVHKKSINVAVLCPESYRKPDAEWKIANTPSALKRMVKKVRRFGDGPVVFCYEAGPCGYAVQRELQRYEVVCDVIAPSLIPVKPGERIKTDRRDARKLAYLHKSELLTVVRPPTSEEEAIRDLTRAREAAKDDLQRARHRLSKMLLRHGLHYTEGNAWTKRHRAWLKRQRLPIDMAQKVLDRYMLAVEQAEERHQDLVVLLEDAAADCSYSEQVGWLRCFRGIDTITAMTIAAELHGFSRFEHPRDLMGYLGLTPSEYTTSDRPRRGAITKAGNGHVRRVLVEAAWNYRHRPAVTAHLRRRRKDQPPAVIAMADRAQHRLHRRYRRLKEVKGKHHNVVTVAVARELVGFIWAALNHQSLAA